MQKTVDKGSACCLTTTFRSCEHELERSRRKMTNKKFKLAAMSLATAVAVSAVGPSASAVTYQLEKGDVTVGQDGTGAYSYQNQTDGKTDNVYVIRIPKTMAKSSSRRQKVQKRIIPSLWKKMSRTRRANVMWISFLTA